MEGLDLPPVCTGIVTSSERILKGSGQVPLLGLAKGPQLL